jgi:drug/metabolite transporter (DMT)-like permease
LLLQPSLATIWGVLFFAENLGLIQYIGASIILIAIYLGSVKKVGGLQ